MISKTQAKISFFNGLLGKRNSINVFVNHISDIGSISVICQDLIQLNKKQSSLKMGKEALSKLVFCKDEAMFSLSTKIVKPNGGKPDELKSGISQI